MGEAMQAAAYLALALVCFVAAQRPGQRRSTVIALWLGAAVWSGVAMAGALSLGGEVSQLGRQAAWMEGWYADRRPVQSAFVIVLVSVTLGTALVLGLLPVARAVRFLGALWAAMVGFLAIRMVSLHALDGVLYDEGWMGLSRGILLEVGITAAATAWVLAAFVLRPRKGFRADSVTKL